jgi:putative nucleotidyltransferase with HDIG domain
MSTPDDRYRSLRHLPQFPAIATKVLRVLSHDDARIREIANLVRADASLASELLRIVNSPLYGFPSRVHSIESALTILGFDAVRSFVLTVSMKSFFQAPLRLDILRGIWRHSLACAIVCEDLSVACSPAGVRDDRAYTAGLLHDIGRMGLFVEYPEKYADLLAADGTSPGILERERETLGVDHCEAGGWLARNWGLPEVVQRAAEGHHKPADTAHFDVESVVRVGVLLADCLGFDVAPAVADWTLPQIRALLPQTAQYRFDPEPVEMKARITEKLDAFD